LPLQQPPALLCPALAPAAHCASRGPPPHLLLQLLAHQPVRRQSLFRYC